MRYIQKKSHYLPYKFHSPRSVSFAYCCRYHSARKTDRAWQKTQADRWFCIPIYICVLVSFFLLFMHKKCKKKKDFFSSINANRLTCPLIITIGALSNACLFSALFNCCCHLGEGVSLWQPCTVSYTRLKWKWGVSQNSYRQTGTAEGWGSSKTGDWGWQGWRYMLWLCVYFRACGLF